MSIVNYLGLVNFILWYKGMSDCGV